MAERVLPTTSVGERTFRGAGVQEGGTGEIPTIFKFCRYCQAKQFGGILAARHHR